MLVSIDDVFSVPVFSKLVEIELSYETTVISVAKKLRQNHSLQLLQNRKSTVSSDSLTFEVKKSSWNYLRIMNYDSVPIGSKPANVWEPHAYLIKLAHKWGDASCFTARPTTVRRRCPIVVVVVP
jgi:hypothetical protein